METIPVKAEIPFFVIFWAVVIGIWYFLKQKEDQKNSERKLKHRSEANLAREILLENSRMDKLSPCESPIEKDLRSILAGRGGLVSQCPVYAQSTDKTYRLDFAFPNYKVGFEADGFDYHQIREFKLKDAERDAALAKEGWAIYRFYGSLIKRHPEYVKSEIDKIISLYESCGYYLR